MTVTVLVKDLQTGEVTHSEAFSDLASAMVRALELRQLAVTLGACTRVVRLAA